MTDAAMTDRELVQFAAKAWSIDGEYHDGPEGRGIYMGLESRSYVSLYWNPLLDPCDALELAANLRIQITATGSHVYAKWENITAQAYVPPGKPLWAACRAITMCAAQIGKEMP